MPNVPLEESSPDPASADERKCVPVPMRDGIALSVDIYSPTTGGERPAILSLTPYDNSGLRAEGRWYAEHGYVYVGADQRGRFDSEGVYDPFDARHKDDGYDLVEWIAAQPWCTGKVGMCGGSASGWTQWWTASAAPPHLAAIVPLVAPPDHFESVPYQNGVLAGGWFLDWSAMMAGRSIQATGPGAYAGWGEHRTRDHARTPFADINALRGIEAGGYLREWLERNRSDDPYWAGIAYQGPGGFGKIGVPSLNVSGWFDGVYPGTPQNYVGMRDFGATAEARRPRMIVGPWTHGINQQVVAGIDFGPQAVIDLEGLTLRWFDHFLKGEDNGVDREPPVSVFVMGENAWHDEADWPLPQAVPTPFYLTAGGVLTTSASEPAGSDRYVYDPRHPTIDVSEAGADPEGGRMGGPVDTSASTGAGVLLYRTPPLESAVEVTGPLEAVLYAATSARDSDWFVRLVDIHPDGRSLLLAEGALRARNRDPGDDGRFNGAQLSEIVPGDVYRYTIRFWRDTANLFLAGHRIGIEISSSWFPRFLPNLNTGADNLATVSIDEAVVATQTVHHGPEAPSHVLLPIVPPRATAQVRAGSADAALPQGELG